MGGVGEFQCDGCGRVVPELEDPDNPPDNWYEVFFDGRKEIAELCSAQCLLRWSKVEAETFARRCSVCGAGEPLWENEDGSVLVCDDCVDGGTEECACGWVYDPDLCPYCEENVADGFDLCLGCERYLTGLKSQAKLFDSAAERLEAVGREDLAEQLWEVAEHGQINEIEMAVASAGMHVCDPYDDPERAICY